MIDPKEFFALFLPPDTQKYFDFETVEVKEGPTKYMGKYGFDDEYTLVLVEKEILPDHPNIYKGKQLRTKGYSDIILEDFPLRGRKTKLLFRRRKWQIEGEPGIIQRKFEISTKGVRYTEDFAFFFEARDRE